MEDPDFGPYAKKRSAILASLHRRLRKTRQTVFLENRFGLLRQKAAAFLVFVDQLF